MSERPPARMPLTSHRDLGRWLLEAIHSTVREQELSSRLEFVRRSLHTWLREEYSETELPSSVYRNLYFGIADTPSDKPGSGRIETLSDCDRLQRLVRNCTETIVENYPQCLETEALLISLSGAVYELNRMRKKIEMYGDLRDK
jgi:hypothetical protein|uniref:DUF5623 domain-containing protein n=1 Tax=Leptospirillum ferriphilum TaxID=178606 RepID=A0A7C3R374_9BACT